MAIFQNSTLAESGDYRKALDYLEGFRRKGIFLYENGSLMINVKCQLQLGHLDGAKETFYSLFERGSTED